MGFQMSLKSFFLHSHHDIIQTYPAAVSNAHDESFSNIIFEIKTRNQSRFNPYMINPNRWFIPKNDRLNNKKT